MNDVQPDSITRREVLRGAAVMLALTVSGLPGVRDGLTADPQATAPNVIQQENAREGATDWQLTRTRVDNPLEGKAQPTPEPDERTMHECRWEPSAELTIPADWISGDYLGRLTTLPDADDKPYWQSYVVFIVRDDRPADILFQCSDNTWQAYNGWPYKTSLYTHPKGNYVFNAATIFWCQDLSMPPGHTLPWSHWSRPHGPDPRVQQITVNLLRRAGCLP